MGRRVVLGVIEEWDTVHLLSEPGSLATALCGFRPSLPWRRVWIQTASDPRRFTGCGACIRSHEAGDADAQAILTVPGSH